MSDTMHQIHQIRRDWQTVRTRLALYIQMEREAEDALRQARLLKREAQQTLTDLEVAEKELLGQIQKPCPTRIKKERVEKAVDISLKDALKHLSPEEKEALVASLMEGVNL